MNHTDYTFPRRKAILQVFRHATSMLKAEWRANGRRDALDWPDYVTSTTGGVEGNRVVLNESALRVPQDFAASDIVVINDLKSGPLPMPMPTVDSRALRLLPLAIPHLTLGEWYNRPPDLVIPPAYDLLAGAGGPRAYELFTIRRSGDDLDLHLDYSGHARTIGQPRRADYRLAVLRPNEPVRIVINGRQSTWSEARYNLFDFIVIHLGEHATFQIRPWNEMAARKAVPVSSAKVVDLEAQLF